MSAPENLLEPPKALPPAPPATRIRLPFRDISFRLAVTVPLAGWRLRDLQSLEIGQILRTEIAAAEDVPVCAGAALLGHAELDNVDGQMAVRLTRLS